MMKHFKILFLILFIIMCGDFLHAQSSDAGITDSLLGVLNSPAYRNKEDTNKVRLLSTLSQLYLYGNTDEGIKYGNLALLLAEQLRWDKGKAHALMATGRNYWRKGDIGQALKKHFYALALYQKMGNKYWEAQAYTYIGQDYGDGGTFPEALKYFALALKLYEELGDKGGIANMYILIAWTYNELGNRPEAVKYDYAALKKYEEIGDKYGMGVTYANIAEVYYESGKYNEALDCYLKNIKTCAENNDIPNVGYGHNGAAKVYMAMGKYDEAYKSYLTALRILEKISDKVGSASTYRNIGELFMVQGNYNEALKNVLMGIARAKEAASKIELVRLYQQAGICYVKTGKTAKAQKYFDDLLILSKEMNSLSYFTGYYQGVIVLDSTLGRWKDAFYNHKQFVHLRDSANNTENTRKIMQTQIQYDFDKKEAAAKAIQDRKNIQQRNIRNSIIAGMAGLLVFTVVVYRQRNKIKQGKKQSDELLLNILPAEVAEELKAKGSAEAKLIDEVTVLFTDFKGFTQLSEKLSPKELVGEINTCFSAFDNIMQKHGVEKIKTIGDAYMAAGGLPTPNKTHAEDVVKAALEIQDFMHRHKAEREAAGKLFFEIRIGVHTGPVVAGIVGIKKFAYDIWGDTVNTASRMESSGSVGMVNISETTYELVKDKFSCEYRGEVEAKGKGVMKMYFVS